MKPSHIAFPLFSLFIFIQSPFASPIPIGEPESVGFSTKRLNRIAPWAERLQSENKIAGAVTMVARKGKLIHFESHGYVDIASKSPMKTDTIFALASMTKPIAAVGALILLEDQKLLLSDPLEKFLPSFRNPQVAVARKSNPSQFDLVPADRSITILDLLTHQAGFPGQPSVESPATRLRSDSDQEISSARSLAESVDRIAALPLDSHPGTKWRYGDSTLVLGRVIEIASGKPLDQFLSEQIFKPLGMVDTSFGVPMSKRDRIASIYLQTPGSPLEKLPPRDTSPLIFSASGGLYSTASDYLRFSQMLLSGGEFDGRRILGRKTIELMTMPVVDNIPLSFLSGQAYGLTVAVLQPSGASGLLGSPGTYGWSGAYNTYFRIDPKEQIVLAIFQQLRPGNNLEATYGFQNLVMSSLED